MLPVRRGEFREGWPSIIIASSPGAVERAITRGVKRREFLWVGRIEHVRPGRWEAPVWRVKEAKAPTPVTVKGIAVTAAVLAIFGGFAWMVHTLLNIIERHWPSIVGTTCIIGVVLLALASTLRGGGDCTTTVKITHRH